MRDPFGLSLLPFPANFDDFVEAEEVLFVLLVLVLEDCVVVTGCCGGGVIIGVVPLFITTGA